jgi:hypothetical protein
LSNVDADRQQPRLLERSWFDVPLVYVSQRRAIIAIERAPRRRAFNDAFATWGSRAAGLPRSHSSRLLGNRSSV